MLGSAVVLGGSAMVVALCRDEVEKAPDHPDIKMAWMGHNTPQAKSKTPRPGEKRPRRECYSNPLHAISGQFEYCKFCEEAKGWEKVSCEALWRS